MGNINFSADMVGIQTLAQQGKSISQDNTGLAMGSFEAMIMQLVADNVSVMPQQNTEAFVEQDKTDEKELILDALMSGMVSPELPIVDMNNLMIDTSVIDTPIIDMSSIQSQAVQMNDVLPTAIVQPQLEQVQEVAQNTTVIDADVVVNVDDSLQTNVIEENVIEVADDISVVDTVKNNIKIDNVPMQNTETKEAVTVASTQNTENNNTANMSDKQESFISTEDMLMMRAGNKIDFSANKAVFKVAEQPVNIESPTAVTDLTDKILMRLTDNEFEVELYPKNLGKITVTLAVENGVVNVTLNGTNDKVNEFLASQSANIQNIVEKNTQYQAVVKLDDSQEQYQQQRDNAQQGANENQKNRQQEHLQQLYAYSEQQTTADFLSMLSLV